MKSLYVRALMCLTVFLLIPQTARAIPALADDPKGCFVAEGESECHPHPINCEMGYWDGDYERYGNVASLCRFLHAQEADEEAEFYRLRDKITKLTKRIRKLRRRYRHFRARCG